MLIDETTRVVVQGMTGREGSRATKEMLAEGTRILCGVTPGKGGREVEGLPVYDSVAEAATVHPDLNTSVLFVPPLLVLDAALEAIDAGITLLIIVTENVPILDTAKMIEYAHRHGARIVGPSSIGVLVPGVGKLGSIGSAREARMYSNGDVAILSKSGGMCAETARLLTREGIGQSVVVGVGGDVLVGSTFCELMELLEKDEATKAIVLFAEIGGAAEEEAARAISEKRCTKPVIAYINGLFAERIGTGLALGHAGAILEEGFGSAEKKRTALKRAGASVADYHDEIPKLVKKALKR